MVDVKSGETSSPTSTTPADLVSSPADHGFASPEHFLFALLFPSLCRALSSKVKSLHRRAIAK